MPGKDPVLDFSIDAELAALAAPLREKFTAIEAEISALTARRDSPRADRTKIVGALRAVDPTFATEPSKKAATTNGGAKKKQIAEEMILAIGAYLEANRPEFSIRDGFDGFTPAELARREDFQWSASTAVAACAELHARGILRLDHTGRGGGKWYLLV